MFETTQVFSSGEFGYQSYRIPVVCVTAKGTVLCATEARNTKSDWGEIDILCRRSTDSGKTFAPPQKVAEWAGDVPRDEWQLRHSNASKTGRTYNNPVLIAARDGSVHLLFCIEYSRAFHRVSRDDGQTWSEVHDITGPIETLRHAYNWRVVATGPGHGLQLQNGRLLVPIWLARGSEGPGGDHRPSVVSSLFSDDGVRWHCGDIVAREDDPLHNPSETVAAELPDGRVVFNMRNESPEHRRAVAFSSDGATDWSRPKFQTDLYEPVCHAGLVRSGDDLLFSHPDPRPGAPQQNENRSGERRNLTVKVSSDSGQSWPISRVLDANGAGYSDLQVLPDGTFLCFYEHGTSAEPKASAGTHSLVHFDRDWILNG